LLALSGVAALAEKRVALVIGIRATRTPGGFPIRQGRGFHRDMFRKSGYEVSFSRTSATWISSGESAGSRMPRASGHRHRVLRRARIEIGGTNYVIPVDAKLASDRDAADEAIELTRIIQSVDGAKRLRLVILDACRDNPFLATMKRQRQALRQVASGSDRSAMSARKRSSPTPPSRASPRRMARRAQPLHHRDPGQSDRAGSRHPPRLRRVRDEVLKITNNRQEPYVYGSLAAAISRWCRRRNGRSSSTRTRCGPITSWS